MVISANLLNKFVHFTILLPSNFLVLSYLVTGTSNNGRKDSSWGIITSKSSFAHARAIINDQSSSIFVTHFELILRAKNLLNSEGGKRLMSNDCALGHRTLYM
jgi:hypothetical protein